MPPIRFGMKKIVRNTFVPFNPLVKRSATINARTLIRMLDTAAKSTVSQNACVKVSSANTFT